MSRGGGREWPKLTVQVDSLGLNLLAMELYSQISNTGYEVAIPSETTRTVSAHVPNPMSKSDPYMGYANFPSKASRMVPSVLTTPSPTTVINYSVFNKWHAHKQHPGMILAILRLVPF